MSVKTDHIVLKEWRKEKKKIIAAFLRLAESLEVAHRDKAKVETTTATVSLMGDIIGLAGVVLAPVSAGGTLIATAVASSSTIGSFFYNWNADKKDKETTKQIEQDIGQLYEKDKNIYARFQDLFGCIEFLREQFYILNIDGIATSLYAFSDLPTDMTVELLSTVNGQDSVKTIGASNAFRTTGTGLTTTHVAKEVKDVSRAVTYTKESSDVLKAASEEGKEVVNQVKDKSTAELFKDVKDISETVTDSLDTIRAVTKVLKDATDLTGMTGKVQSAKETPDAVSKAAKFVLDVKDISETFTEASETIRTVTKVAKDAKDITETIKSVRDMSDGVKASIHIAKKVNDISDAVIGLKETTYAAKAATKAIKDVNDISKTVKSTKEASNTLTTATKAIREVKDASRAIRKIKETSKSMNSVTKVIKDVKSISGTVTSVKETSDTVKTATTFAKDLKDVSKTAKSLQESSAVVETISQVTKDAVKGTAKVVNDVKRISETVRNTKETTYVVKTATKLTKDVAESTKQVTITATTAGKAMSALKTSSVRTLNSAKGASKTVKTASKIAKDSTSAVKTTCITKSAGGVRVVSKSAASVSKLGLAISAVCIPLDVYNLYQAQNGLSQSYADVGKIRKDVQRFEKEMDDITTIFRKECDYFQKLFNILCKLYKDHRIKEVYEYIFLLHDKLGLEKIPRLQDERVWTECMQNMTDLKDHLPKRGTKQFCLKMFLSEIFTPLYWTYFHSGKSVKQWKISEEVQSAEIIVDVDDQTFLAVKTLVESTWEPSKVGIGKDAKGLRELNMTALKVRSVKRIENITLYGQYCQRRQDVFYNAAKEFESGIPRNKETMVEENLNNQWKSRLYEEVNEGYFFHGTRSDIVTNVLKQGLDPRMSNGGSVIGQGIYMAESSTKADQYADNATNRQTKGLQMFLVRACLGNTCTLKEPRKLKRPPCCIVDCLSDACGHENRHDSVVLEKFIFREFVAFESPLIYPEYLITYDRAA